MKMLVKGIIAFLIFLCLFLLFFFYIRNNKPEVFPYREIPDARTLYEGFVEIEPLQFNEIKKRLEEINCFPADQHQENIGKCIYLEREILKIEQIGIEVFPRGPGFGPTSFYLTQNKLWADKDIYGIPNKELYIAEVRKDIESIRNIVQIKENTWKIERMEYPWTVIY